MSDGPSGEAMARNGADSGAAEPFAFPRSPPTPLAKGLYKKGWIFAALIGADLFVGAVCHALLGFGPLWSAALMAALPAVVAAAVSRLLLRPKWQRNTTHEQGLVPEIIGQAKRFYGVHIRNPKDDFQLAFRDIVVTDKDEGDNKEHTLRAWYVPAKEGVGAGGGGSKGERTVVVCVHGAGRDRRAFLRHTPALHAAGLSVVLMDCREHGTSAGRNRGIVRDARGPRCGGGGVARAHRTRVCARRAVGYVAGRGGSDRRRGGVRTPCDRCDRGEPVRHARRTHDPHPRGHLRHCSEAARAAAGRVPQTDCGVCAHAIGCESECRRHERAGEPDRRRRGAAVRCAADARNQRRAHPLRPQRTPLRTRRKPKALWLAEQAEHTGLHNAYPVEFERRMLEFIRAARTPIA